jgi:hypothetical protein
MVISRTSRLMGGEKQDVKRIRRDEDGDRMHRPRGTILGYEILSVKLSLAAERAFFRSQTRRSLERSNDLREEKLRYGDLQREGLVKV